MRVMPSRRPFMASFSTGSSRKSTCLSLKTSVRPPWSHFSTLTRRVSLGGDFQSIKDQKLIGVLDIFGFESFETNSFEQLCINYCNEKLQFHFNNYIFTLEQDEYKAEGVDVSMVSFKSNGPTLELIENKAGGILSQLDEERPGQENCYS